MEDVTNLQPDYHAPLMIAKEHQEESIVDEELFSDSSNSKRKPRETNTNLLKNLVVTLRTWVKFDDYSLDSTVRILWDNFKTSSKINKNLILMLFANEKSTKIKHRAITECLTPSNEILSLGDLLPAQ